MSASEPSGEEYVFVDFDNIFAFVPEFDLCKLHFSMLECGIRVGLQELAELVASAYGVSLHAAEVGLRRFYPLVLCRLLAWAIKRARASSSSMRCTSSRVALMSCQEQPPRSQC